MVSLYLKCCLGNPSPAGDVRTNASSRLPSTATVSFSSAWKSDAKEESRMCASRPSFVPRMGKTVERGCWMVTLKSESKFGLKSAGYESVVIERLFLGAPLKSMYPVW